MSYFDTYRNWPGGRDSTAGYPFTSIEDRAGDEHDPALARTQYSGHKAPPSHVTEARHRREVLVNASTGEALANLTDDNLRAQASKALSMAQAVNQVIQRSPSDAGSVGGDLVLQRPARTLPALLLARPEK